MAARSENGGGNHSLFHPLFIPPMHPWNLREHLSEDARSSQQSSDERGEGCRALRRAWWADEDSSKRRSRHQFQFRIATVKEARTRISEIAIGCARSPFNPRIQPLAITLWTFLRVTVKLQSGKALGRRQGASFRRLLKVRGRSHLWGLPF